MKLKIDTTNNLATKIWLNDTLFEKNYESPRDQDVLGSINSSLEESDSSLADLTSIEVNLGPGSFTGIRVGIAIAQAMSLSLNIPVNGQNAPAVLMPEYGKSPGITPKIK